MRITLLIILLLVAGWLPAQHFNQWHFGKSAVLDFNGGAPVASDNSAISAHEGSASIADNQGNLLFYTDGVTVWNRNHLPMPSGAGLKGDSSSTQSALISPVPGTADQYYVFTVDDATSSGDLCYSLIDMSLDGGLGDIVPGWKNILLGTNFTEKLVSASADCKVWVLAHQRDNSEFYAFPAENQYVGSPVISVSGTPHSGSAFSLDSYVGMMTVSKDNAKIALVTETGLIEVFSFDALTGMVSDPVTIPPPASSPVMMHVLHGICFAPGGQFLYVGESEPNSVFQYDLSSGTPAGILATKTLVGNPLSPGAAIFQIQRGPDDKLYIARYNTNLLDVITDPDAAGTGCGYVSGGIVLPVSNSCRIGLPNEPRFPHFMDLAVDLGQDLVLCPGTMITLQSPSEGPWLWSTGSTDSAISVSAGTYWLEAGGSVCVTRDSIVISFDSGMVDAGNDITVCEGTAVTLSASGANTYSWSGGVSDGIPFVPAASQVYTVTGTSSTGCNTSDQVTVTVEPLPGIQFSADPVSGCTPLNVSFAAAVPQGSSCVWNFGDGTTGTGPMPAHLYMASGCHDVTLSVTSSSGCTGALTFADHICAYTPPTASFVHSPETLSRENMEITFVSTSENADSVVWSFGDQATSTVHSPAHLFPETVEGYEVTLTTYNAAGCMDEVRTYIPFVNVPLYYVPNAFTPDGNEHNQVFLPVFTAGFDPSRYQFQVFNRWGELLFESYDHLRGWDGASATGTIVPDGTYVWKIYFSPPDSDERRLLTGHVVLLR